jgi:hypothetical protein
LKDLKDVEMTEFTAVARACVARALESHLKKGPLKNIVKTLLDLDQPIDAIAHLNGTVHLARNSDTLMDAQFKYKGHLWQSELCTQSFFNMFDAALEDYRSEQRHGNKMSIREHWQQLMYVWRLAKEWRFENVISRYQEKFNGEDEPPPQEWHKFVSEIVRKATEFNPNTVGRVYPPLTAHQPAQGQDAAPSPPVSMPTRGVLPPSLGGPQPSAFPSSAPAPAPSRPHTPRHEHARGAQAKEKAYRTIARCWIKFLNRAGEVEVCGKEHASILDCTHLDNRVNSDKSKYYKPGESFGNNTNQKAAFMLAASSVLDDGSLPPEAEAMLKQMNDDALEAGEVLPSSPDADVQPSSQTAGARPPPSVPTAGAGVSSVQQVQDLCGLGYDRAHVVHCLNATDFDVNDAMRMLMNKFSLGVEGAPVQSGPPASYPVTVVPKPYL